MRGPKPERFAGIGSETDSSLPCMDLGFHASRTHPGHLLMSESVVADLMALVQNFLDQLGKLLGMSSEHKESGLRIERAEMIQNSRSGFGIGTIVEREGDLAYAGGSFREGRAGQIKPGPIDIQKAEAERYPQGSEGPMLLREKEERSQVDQTTPSDESSKSVRHWLFVCGPSPRSECNTRGSLYRLGSRKIPLRDPGPSAPSPGAVLNLLTTP